MPLTNGGDATLYWELEGDSAAPPLVLLNSIGTDMHLWDSTLPILRKHFKLLRIDTRGHGASSAPARDYTLASLAQDVAAAMDAASIASARIAGVSLGGMIAMQLALDAPSRVTALALVCTSATMDRGAWADRVELVRAKGMESIADLVMGRFLSPAFVAERPEVAATVRRELLIMSADGYAGCGAAIRDMQLLDRLGATTCRTLVVTGARDTSTPLEGHGEHLLAAIAGARHVSLDAAHLAPLEAPEALATAFVQHFVDQI